MSLKHLKVIGIVLPVVFLLLADLVRHRLWFSFLHTWQGLLLSGFVFVGLAVGFTLVIFDRIERLSAANARLRVEAQEALSFLENLVHHSADAVVVTAADGRIILWNEGAETRYGFSREEATGLSPAMAPPERLGEIEAILERVKQGQVVRNHETQRLRRDGRPIDVLLTVTPLRNVRGEVVAALEISKEVTWEKQVERQTQQLALLMDRERICMDLHDSAIQSIYAVALQLEGCVDRLEEDPSAVRDLMQQVIDALHATNQDIRSFIMDLRPQTCAEGELEAELANMLDRVGGLSQISRQLQVKAEVRDLDRDQVRHVLQIAREALSNVHRHAGATAVNVTVDAVDGGVRLAIQDNGRGLDLNRPPDTQQMGLRNMAVRAQAIGGALQIASTPGVGTTLEVTVPDRAGERPR